jgi:membrane-bound lytic murein transglycosylase A
MWLVAASVIGVASLAGCVTPPKQPPALGPLQLTQARFAELEGWRSSNPQKGLVAFRRSCNAILDKAADSSLGGAGYAGKVAEWSEACHQAAAITNATADAARGFFEAAFVPYRVSQGRAEGLFTGYFEPELKGSRTRHGPYQTPLYAVPPDLVRIERGVFRDTSAAMMNMMMMAMMSMRFVPYPARAEIERDGIPATPLFYVDDPVDAFFLQIQGSGRVVLDDGSVVRAAYAGQNGQPYTAIGAILIERGELTREEVSLQSIRAWLLAHPDEAREVMDANASYVFFAEQPIGDPTLGAIGSEGVPLTPGASLAVDVGVHALGVPVWLEASAPDPDPGNPDRAFDALVVAQDSGGAIKGSVRGDVYWGYGGQAGAIAGRMKHEGRMTVLLPRAVAARLGPRALFAAPQ